MKLKVIAKIMDGVIACNRHNIVCFHENSLRDDKGEDSLYWADEGIPVGRILKSKNHQGADIYWSYSRKEWEKMNTGFQRIDL
jgi:hypothetical protein